MFYIMTLGTTREVRRCGLGSVLVDRVVNSIEEIKDYGALYLHVIKFNEGAIQLYIVRTVGFYEGEGDQR